MYMYLPIRIVPVTSFYFSQKLAETTYPVHVHIFLHRLHSYMYMYVEISKECTCLMTCTLYILHHINQLIWMNFALPLFIQLLIHSPSSYLHNHTNLTRNKRQQFQSQHLFLLLTRQKVMVSTCPTDIPRSLTAT